jgi:hypothetical protein
MCPSCSAIVVDDFRSRNHRHTEIAPEVLIWPESTTCGGLYRRVVRDDKHGRKHPEQGQEKNLCEMNTPH